jgi:hypothetical protein
MPRMQNSFVVICRSSRSNWSFDTDTRRSTSSLGIILSRAAVLKHLSVPTLGAAAVFIYAVRHEGFTWQIFAYQLLYTWFFFAAPHVLWAVMARVAGLRGKPWHGGFVVCSALLTAIWLLGVFGRRDPSGLPYHWVLYWPTCAAALVLLGGGSMLWRWRADA